MKIRVCTIRATSSGYSCPTSTFFTSLVLFDFEYITLHAMSLSGLFIYWYGSKGVFTIKTEILYKSNAFLIK